MIAGPSFRDAGHLRKCIEAASWSCAETARQSGLERSTVFYWLRAEGQLSGYAPQKLRAALRSAGVDCGPTIYPQERQPAKPDPLLALDRLFGERLAKDQARLDAKAATCGAVRSSGKPCPAKPVPGKSRCKFHGGMSTGPKTEAGRKRLSEAMKARWQAGDFRTLLRARVTVEEPAKA